MPKYISIAGLIACVCLLAYISFRIISPSIKPTPQGDHKNYTQPQPPNEKLYGLTIDDGWYDALPVSDVVTGIKQLPVKPTVRIVMSKDRTPQSYIALFKAIHSVADIMAQPVDSFDLQSYSVDQYRQRFETSYQYLSQYTSIWEIGNEINSDWIREDPNQITEKIAAAYRLIKNKHGIAALTPYYFPPNEGTLPMEDWLKKIYP